MASIKGIDFAEIITFNTFALKGAIREIGRALNMPLSEVDEIAKAVEKFNGKDHIDESYKKRYPELFKYVDLLNGVIFAMGSHPSGFVVSPIDLDSHIGTVYTKESKYKVTSVNMGELDGENYVKLDILGLDNIELINETCKLAGIERLTPDNVDINDINVWKSLRESTLGVFQFESDTAHAYIKQLFSDKTLENIRKNVGEVSYIDLLSMANGAIRPSGASYRDQLAEGIPKDNGHPALNRFLKDTLGYCIEENQLVSTIDGYKKIKDIAIGDLVYTKDGKHYVVNKKYMGKKNVIEIVASNNRSIVCTKDHKILTVNGWKEAKDITINDCIAYRINNESDKSFDYSKLKIIAYLLGDGILTTKNIIGFINANEEIAKDFKNAIENSYKNLTTSLSVRPSRVNKIPLYLCYVKGRYGKLNRRDNELLNFLVDIGLKNKDGGGCHANNKFIPQFIFGLDYHSLSVFISAFFDTDGSMDKHGNIRFKTSSSQLAYDLQEIGRLLGFTFTVNKNEGKSYDITVNNSKKFINDVLLKNSIKINKHIQSIEYKHQHKRIANSNAIPISLAKQIFDELVESHNTTYHLLFKQYGFKKGYSSSIKNMKQKHVSVNVMKRFKDIIPEKYQYIFDENIVWMKVKKIIDRNEQANVYDLEIESEHNFIVNGFVVHNCIFQEQIMKFLTDFANHTGAESDTVRRGLAKKKGTEQYLPKIRERFIRHMMEHYGESKEHAEEIIESFLQVISDASNYGFSINHSTPYSYTGYIGAYLRYYYPLEFLTVILNLQNDDKEKTGKIMNYAKKRGIVIKPIEFGKSRAFYSFNREEQAIYKGVASIKFLNKKVAEELYQLSQEKEYDKDDFVGLLRDIMEKTSADTRQMEILIRLDFFKEFGPKEALLEIYLTMADKKKANTAMYPEFADKEIIEEKVDKRTGRVTKKKRTIKKPLKYGINLKDKTKEERLKNLREYEKAVKANPPRKIELYEQIKFEKENLGYAVSTYPQLPNNVALVLDVDTRYKPVLTLYKVKTGEEVLVKVDKKKFFINDEYLLYKGDIIQVLEIENRYGWKRINGKWVEDKSKIEPHLNKCKIIRKANR